MKICKMRWLLAFLPVTDACWLYSKETAVDKIRSHLGHRTYVDRAYIQEMEMEPSCFLADPMEIIDDEFSFPRFSEDPTEQNRLNVRYALKKSTSGMPLTEIEQNNLPSSWYSFSNL